MTDEASIKIQRRIEWSDTDATGIYHWLTAFRLVEAAEAELHDRLGIRAQTFGRMPRAHAEADFRAMLKFFDVVDVSLRVTSAGRTSVSYAFTVSTEGRVAVEGHIVAVFVDLDADGKSCALPDAIREQLVSAGPQGYSKVT